MLWGEIHMFFISKRDGFYTFLIWGGIVVGILTMIYPIFSTLSILNVFLLFIGLIIIGWLIWLWFSTGYLVENNTLKMLVGPFKQTIDIQRIKKITKERSIVTSPALAVDRLIIQYGHCKYVSISPKKEYEFIKLLLSKNPHIQIDDTLSDLNA